MSYAWVYLYRSYIVLDPLTCGACYLESFARENICTKQEYCLCIQIFEPSFFHECPPYLPICGIYLPFQVNLYVPNSKPSNKHSVLYARIAHVSTRAALIFHVRRVILKRSGLRSSLTRKWLVTGMPSPMLYAN